MLPRSSDAPLALPRRAGYEIGGAGWEIVGRLAVVGAVGDVVPKHAFGGLPVTLGHHESGEVESGVSS